MIPAVLSIATFISTLLGGMFALRFRDKLHLILGFSAGAMIGVVFFDLIPESIQLAADAYSISAIVSVTAVGFILYMLLDRLVVMHGHSEEDAGHANEHRGIFGAGSIAVHSFLDGAAIGVAFQASAAIGTAVAIAVFAHRFFDGINTVSLILKSGGQQKAAMRWLLISALAPILGIISAAFFSLPKSSLGLALAIFAGFFLYISTSDLLPESHHSHPTIGTTIMTVVGAAALYAIIMFAGL